jgi:orotate phosphoribosyltransferase/AMMECR1 domain-containing protein
MAAISALHSELRNLLRRQAVLYGTPSAPITHRDGQVSPWAFYSWNVTLTAGGLRLAARAILAAAESFGTTQLASYGYTGLPLLAACVLEGNGKYTGLSIREKRKTHLTNRRVDGVIDHGRPVLIIDDSLSSGTSLHKAIKALEDEGLEVEGTIALVHFPYRGAKQWANTAGYRTVTLFDIWSDLGMAADETPYAGAARERCSLASTAMPEGLAPAVLARRVAEFFLRTGQIPRWPARLDASYDARGGTFVSFRRRADDERVARDGFWHFDPADADGARDVVLATVDTLLHGNGRITPDSLDELKIGVTFFGPLEEIQPRQLDFDRYGIVVRSKVWPGKIGGALPNTQVFISDIEQYRHARRTNARVADGEPHALYRHTLSKFTEPSETWLPYGCEEHAATSWWRDDQLGTRLTRRAREVISAACRGSGAGAPLPRALVPVPIDGVAVTLYARGLCGYGLSHERDLDRALVAAAETAWRDPRFAATRSAGPDAVSIAVSVLHHGESLGAAPRSLVERKLRRGLDAVTLAQGGSQTTLLPSALVFNDWSRAQLLDAVESIAGGVQPSHCWTTHQVAAWVSQRDAVLPLRFGFPAKHPHACVDGEREALIDLMAGYIFRSLDGAGLPAYRLTPSDSEYQRVGTAARVVHGLYALRIAGELRGRTDWKDAALAGVRRCLGSVRGGRLELDGHVGGALADVVLLAAASACGSSRTEACAEVAERVATLLHASGWIGAGPKRLDNPQDQEFLPGAAVWAIATWCRHAGVRLPAALAAARRFYGQRLLEHPTWGCSWLAQGWAAVHDLTRAREDAELAFAAADWALDRQLEKNGAFLEDLSPDEPSFNTGFVAEGVAAAWRAAVEQDDDARAARYQQSWRMAAGFVSTLTLGPADVFPFATPERAVGGVRCTLSRSDIRVDQVSHALHALVDGQHNLSKRRQETSDRELHAQSAANL